MTALRDAPSLKYFLSSPDTFLSLARDFQLTALNSGNHAVSNLHEWVFLKAEITRAAQ